MSCVMMDASTTSLHGTTYLLSIDNDQCSLTEFKRDNQVDLSLVTLLTYLEHNRASDNVQRSQDEQQLSKQQITAMKNIGMMKVL